MPLLFSNKGVASGGSGIAPGSHAGGSLFDPFHAKLLCLALAASGPQSLIFQSIGRKEEEKLR